MVGSAISFNSLFEMLAELLPTRVRRHNQVSILYLRCGNPRGGVRRGPSRRSVSILYLRCRGRTPGGTRRRLRKCFNSLFEMLLIFFLREPQRN